MPDGKQTMYAILVILLILGSGTAITTGEPGGTIGSASELAGYVTEISQYLNDTGLDTGIETINHDSEPYNRRDVEISVYDLNGTLLADPVLPEQIGKNQITLTDPYGMEIVRLERDMAMNGSGFFIFMENTIPDGSHNETYSTPRLGYVSPVAGKAWVTADIPLENVINPVTGIPFMKQIEEYVTSAVTYAKEEGKERANQEFNNPNGTFTHGSQYIYAFDMNGTFLASPYYPDLIGTNQTEVVRIYGVASVADGIRLIRERGAGYIAFVIQNPDTGRPEPKLGYIHQVDDTWFVGSGVYASDFNIT